MRLATACLTLLPTLAFAGPFRDAVDDAAQTMDSALGAARRGGRACRQALKAPIDRAVDDVGDLGEPRGERRLGEVREKIAALVQQAGRAGCPEGVARHLARAVEQLDAARGAFDDRRDDRRQRVSTPVEFHTLRITPLVTHEREPVAQIDVTEVRFHELRGQVFRLAARVRALNGQFGEWLVGPTYSVPQDEFAWPNAQTFYFRHATLRPTDTAQGRFVVRVSALDDQNQELGAVEQPFDVPLGAVPPSGAPPAGPNPNRRPSIAVVRDCGTGMDPGCQLVRFGLAPMEKATFLGLMTSLRATGSELARLEQVDAVLRNNAITALQLGQVMDQFGSELNKLDMVRKAAPRIVDAARALGFSAKFRSSLNQTEFVKLMSAQQ